MFDHKYPRTMHLPWSESLQNDDKMIDSLDAFAGRMVVATEKKDGENYTLGNDFIHARSLDSISHFTRDWVKAFWATIRFDIPTGWRVCGENLYARHAIAYDDLRSFFYGFSIWDENNSALSWDSTLEWFDLIGITPVEEIYRGVWNQASIAEAFINYKRGLDREVEGYVVRVIDAIPYENFDSLVAKFVRKDHVQEAPDGSDGHWLYGGSGKIELNNLARE